MLSELNIKGDNFEQYCTDMLWYGVLSSVKV